VRAFGIGYACRIVFASGEGVPSRAARRLLLGRLLQPCGRSYPLGFLLIGILCRSPSSLPFGRKRKKKLPAPFLQAGSIKANICLLY
jgi:hypothetical protein